MKKFFQSGGFFFPVALVCFASSGLTHSGVAVGLIWLILAIAVRAKYTRKQPPADKS